MHSTTAEATCKRVDNRPSREGELQRAAACALLIVLKQCRSGVDDNTDHVGNTALTEAVILLRADASRGALHPDCMAPLCDTQATLGHDVDYVKMKYRPWPIPLRCSGRPTAAALRARGALAKQTCAAKGFAECHADIHTLAHVHAEVQRETPRWPGPQSCDDVASGRRGRTAGAAACKRPAKAHH